MKENATILIVDDDPQSLRAQARLLGRAGYSVAQATTGQGGLRMARDTHPDLILLDVVLPDVNGLEICRRIKADPTLKRPFVVLLSGVGTKSHEQADGLEAGADGVIVRPIANRELLARVEAFLRIQQAEAKLRASEAHYRDVFESAPIGIYRTTPGGKILMANPALVRMLGYDSFEELARRDLESEGYHPEYPHSEFKRRMEEEGHVSGWEAAWRRKDDSILLVREKARAVTDEGGQLVGYQGTVEDITKRKAAEEALRESERRYRALFESTGAATCVFGDDGVIQLCNEDFEALAGLPKRSIEGRMTWSDFVAEKDIERMQRYHAQRSTGTGDPPTEYAFTFVNAQGETRDIYLQIRLVEETGERVGSLTDVTPLRRAEKALRESEERYRTLFESSPEAIALLDLRGTVLDCNPATAEIAGLPREEIIGRPFVELEALEADDLASYGALLSRLVNGERVAPLQLKMTRHDGQIRWLEAFPAPIIKQGETHAIQVIVRDITERRQAEESLHRSVEETAHSQRLLLALSQAAQAVQRARTPEGVYRAIGEQVAGLNFDAAVFTLSEDGTHLSPSHLTLRSNLVRLTEKLTGLSAEGYRIPLPPGGFFQGMIASGETAFQDLDTVPFAEALPRPVRLLVRRLVDSLGWQQAIYAPLTIGGEVQGLLAIAGTDLTESDASAITTFANQAAIAIENARLYKETEQLAAFNESIVQSMAEGIVLEDADGLLTFVNPAAATMLGYTPDELVGLQWADIVPPDQQPIVQAANERRMRGEADRYELDLVRKDGRRFPVFTAGTPRFDASGHFAGTMAVFTDITNLKQAEHALLESKALLSKAEEMARLGSWEWDVEDDTLTLSEGWQRVHGCPASRLSREDLFPIAHPDDQLKIRRAFDQALEGGTPYDIEHRIVRQDDGDVRIIQAHGEWVRDENGKPIKMYGAAQDITERRRAEEALKESEERFRQVYEGMAVGVARVSPASQIEAANEAYCRMLGYREEELIGKHLRDITHPETIEANLRKQAQLAAGEINHYRMEKRFIHKDGHVVHGILDANLVRDAEGNPLYSLGSVVDITDRRRMEEQLHQQERLAAVGQLAGGIAHDFNNILAAIILYAQMPLRRPDLPSAVRNALQTILKESRRAADLIQQILDFSRSGMMKTEALSLGAVVTETLMLLRRTIPEHIRLVTETTAHPCSVQADRTRIQQVLMNLALNAKDAMPEGGELRITVAPVKVAPQDEPPLPDMAPGSWVCLSISDSGIGMNEKVQDHLFEPFFTTKEPGKGTGLGLAQVYGIVKQHEGFIGVDTAVGEGTTFTIFLPLVDDRDEEDAADSGTTALRGRGETILVVEDAERLRRALRAGLEYLEYHVITAANGHEALETVSLQDVDLVLTDLVMPKMGGEELLRSLRAEDPNLRVIALTGHVMDRDVTELKAAGFADAVSKPFSIEDLSRVIRDVLDSEG